MNNTPAAQPDDAELSKLFMQLDGYHITIGEAYEATCAILRRRQAAAVAKARIEELETIKPPEQFKEYAKLVGSEQCRICGFNSEIFRRYIDDRIAELQRHAQEGGAGE